MIYIVLFLLSFILTYVIKNYAIKHTLIAEVNERSSHTIPTPHGGGVAIAITWFLGLSYLFYFNEIESSLYYALMCGAIIAILGYVDDIVDLGSRIRFFVQLFVALWGLYLLGGLHYLDFGFFRLENQYIVNLVAIIGIIWSINLYNFIDGIDGYAGSEAVFLGFAGYTLFGGTHFLVLIVTVLGFLLWNWHKAKIFMGDVGSTFLGYTVAIFTIYYSNVEATNMWIWLVLFSLFWFDATVTLFRRYKNGEKLSQAHKKHAYQRLNQQGWKPNKIVKFSIMINILLCGLVYFIPNIYLVFFISMFLMFTILKYIDIQCNLKSFPNDKS
ncbi:MAG: Undecaprenyl-phosphate N-acetylglucosaminyl 1-phosphate transferase (EC [uncultured Sulfurovum sp.]|uniref:Undecaprenyl-phosphate N-acetylglucosaminyl 1-phosphate transferase (EC) n=1 Tax=uncultured Sulfurovum sp. TaxID=269237 RepID=A0A6S6T1U6_9BACT|nr:MAG: Undecaprenyl-phosphate N-acetylglucosaminyl 1-phosphate transferase (EC [uncultured Sulfurovum sp.]